ncbi:MAG: hypothetical protein R3324_11940, partial [Halobacteriales archaeon]|nr:hypothetical protein [Halobacteriales archaeon]
GLVDPITWDQHPSVGEPKTFDHDGSPEETSIDNVTNHYLSLMSPNVDLQIDDFNGNSVNEDVSTGTLEQEGSGGKFLTFLHITENRIQIEFE